jgi:hypothetical protein
MKFKLKYAQKDNCVLSINCFPIILPFHYFLSAIYSYHISRDIRRICACYEIEKRELPNSIIPRRSDGLSSTSI